MTNTKKTQAADNERSTFITIGGVEYELLLTTRATKEIYRLTNNNYTKQQFDCRRLFGNSA